MTKILSEQNINISALAWQKPLIMYYQMYCYKPEEAIKVLKKQIFCKYDRCGLLTVLMNRRAVQSIENSF